MLLKFTKYLFIIGLSLVIVLLIWLNLPISYTHADEIKLGNHIINNIEQLDELPENDDWVVLKKMSLKPEYNIHEPDYKKLSEQEF